MIKILAIFISFVSIHAKELPCGKYKAYGEVKRATTDVIFFINKNTASEIRLKVEEKLWPTFVPYIESSAHVFFQINAPIEYSDGKIENVFSIDRHFPKPVGSNVTSEIQLIEKMECGK